MPQNKQIVWDLPLRMFHWCLAVCFVVSFVSVKIDNMELHVLSASCMFGLLLFRLLWGFLGSHTARFGSFIPSPKRLFRYLAGRDKGEQYPGHTPLGALSVMAMLLFLIIQVSTGLVADDEIYITGPLRDYVDSDTSSWATGRHVQLSDVLLGLVVLHLAAIVFYWLVRKNNLVKPMISGQKAKTNSTAVDADYSKLNAIFAIAISAFTTYIVFYWI